MNGLRFAFFVALIIAPTALVLSEPARGTAEIDGSVAINCAVLASAIDGDPNDGIVAGDTADACDGIDAIDVAALANALGDQDDSLEPSDFTAIDGPNVVVDGGAGTDDEILLFAFVDNDAVVTFDSTTGLNVTVLRDTDGGASADNDANPETCAADDDLDCDNAVLSDGDGVVVAIAIDNDSSASDPGDLIDVDMFQADDTGNVQTQTIQIVTESGAVNMSLVATPAEVRCDGSEYATVSATVTDADGEVVADGTIVMFAIVGGAEGIVEPPTAPTVGGVASSIITPTAISEIGVTVLVSSGGARASIRIDCEGIAIDCPDFDGDGRVTGRDVAVVARGVRTQDPLFDVDGDGQVNMRDVIAVVRKLRSECPMSPPLR